ncbi:hypothetical protein DAKH74_044430 [Maudiozyma humilis]|uniref:Uncharacterized protein n=1 Tax=Maudiozyma humilis TaxID=51915 RepID=A0AAV5S2K0_MAUHU|nr:hypothetical protein DAKH74_044430 [Kazachstania humilis]
MYAFNNYCAACDKLIANVSKPNQLDRSSSNVSDRAADRLYCSGECERRDKLHIVDSTVTASETVEGSADVAATDADSLFEVTESVQNDGLLGSPASITPLDRIPAVEDVPSITITTVTDDITSKAVLDERELLLASPLLLPLHSNSSSVSKLDINYDHRSDDSSEYEDDGSDAFRPQYFSIPSRRSIYNIPKDLFLGSTTAAPENRSFDHTAENFYKMWLSNNSP